MQYIQDYDDTSEADISHSNFEVNFNSGIQINELLKWLHWVKIEIYIIWQITKNLLNTQIPLSTKYRFCLSEKGFPGKYNRFPNDFKTLIRCNARRTHNNNNGLLSFCLSIYSLNRHNSRPATKSLKDLITNSIYGLNRHNSRPAIKSLKDFKTTNFKLKLNQHFNFKGLCEDLIKVW